MGFSYIKGVGNAKFKKPSRDDEFGLEEFLNLNPSLNKQVCINLVKAGAFAVDPQWGIDYVEWFKKAYKREQECKEKIALYEANGKESLKKSWEDKLVQIPSAPDFSSYSTETSVARRMQREVLSLSTIPFWVDYDKSLCSRNVKMVEVQKFSKFQTKKGDMMYKIIGMDTNLTISEFLFYSPEPLIERHLGDIKVSDVVLIQVGRGSSNGSVWCRDIIKAKKVA
jgi:DNA polymerase III alpha subunit